MLNFMQEIIFKRSAIHNLMITDCVDSSQKREIREISEGLVVPKYFKKKRYFAVGAGNSYEN